PARTAPSLLGETLLVRLLGAASPLLLDDDAWAPADRAAHTTMCAVAPDVARALAAAEQRAWLQVPLDDGAPPSIAPDEGEPRPLPSARFHFRRGRSVARARSSTSRPTCARCAAPTRSAGRSAATTWRRRWSS